MVPGRVLALSHHMGLLQDAVRAAELLLVHMADRQELASRLSATEDRDGRAVC